MTGSSLLIAAIDGLWLGSFAYVGAGQDVLRIALPLFKSDSVRSYPKWVRNQSGRSITT